MREECLVFSFTESQMLQILLQVTITVIYFKRHT